MNYFPKITKISPYISTGNLGDYIIDDYCTAIFSEIFGDYFNTVIPSREHISQSGGRAILSSDYSFVCGTNLLSSDIRRYRQWKVDAFTLFNIASSNLPKKNWLNQKLIKKNLDKIHIILLGVGWLDYQKEPTHYTKTVLRDILDDTYFHSVRDSYTEKMLKNIGINNVINTTCPTMWKLTKEFCRNIPTSKKNSVVVTVTDYRKNTERDANLLKMLLESYQNVYLWLQSYEDISYLSQLGYYDKLIIIPPTLTAYDEFLSNTDVDYIGTRLHGGIRALNNQKRTCIIGIDNRAIEIANDTNLPIILEGKIEEQLPEWIYGVTPTEICIPIDNINRWKNQFR